MWFTDISKYSSMFDYFPIINAILFIELLFLYFLNDLFINQPGIRLYYNKYNISAVIADIFLYVYGFIVVRYFYTYLFKSFSVLKFMFLALIVLLIYQGLYNRVYRKIGKKDSEFLYTINEAMNIDGDYTTIVRQHIFMILCVLFASMKAGNSFNYQVVYLFTHITFIVLLANSL